MYLLNDLWVVWEMEFCLIWVTCLGTKERHFKSAWNSKIQEIVFATTDTDYGIIYK